MALLAMTALPLDKFFVHQGVLVAEASDFGPLREGRWWLQRIYDDAADIGIAILSHHTGDTQLFYLDEEEINDGDLKAYHFKAVDPKCRVQKVTIFND
jgi:hypothetical protein